MRMRSNRGIDMVFETEEGGNQGWNGDSSSCLPSPPVGLFSGSRQCTDNYPGMNLGLAGLIPGSPYTQWTAGNRSYVKTS